jgi:nicotinamide-nucleotide amidase
MDMKMVVGDDIGNLSWTVKNACKRAQLVIVTGGLGPTEDDITREAVAEALKKEMVYHEEIVEGIREVFRSRGMHMPDINTRQAFVIEGAEILPNTVGTAPGQYLEDEKCDVLLLPGPPAEMRPMFDQIFEATIAPKSNFHIYTRSMKFAGITESDTDSRISPLYSKLKNPQTTILASPGIIEISLMGRSRKDPQDMRQKTDALAEKIKAALADFYISEGEVLFEEFILEELRKKNQTLATAESCTGGGLGNRLTHIPGSSDVFVGGVIAYSNQLKIRLLGVRETTLDQFGAVSRQTAEEMARGVRDLCEADVGLGITGIAGPGGGTAEKPVGLVNLHISTRTWEKGIERKFPGDRQTVKTRSENFALNLIREYLTHLKD